MKAFTIAPLAAAAILALTSQAFSQGTCQNEYSACMGTCASRPLKSAQDSCFANCENNNTVCAEKVFGKRPFNGTPSNVAEQQGKTSNALARTTRDQASRPQQQQQAREEQDQQPQSQQQAEPMQQQAQPAAQQGRAPQPRGQAQR